MNTTNPCFCCNCSSTVVHPTPCSESDCLCFCNIIILPDNPLAVSCESNGTLDLTTYEQSTSVCATNPVQYKLQKFDEEFFNSVTVSSAGIVNWQPKRTEKSVTGQIIFAVFCGNLLKNVTLTISRKNMCVNVNCAESEVCDQCTGLCVNGPVLGADITVEVQRN